MNYIKLSIKNTEPLCISDDSTSQSGQTNCYKYIPGSTIRGYVINILSQNESVFNQYKKELFSEDICFLNAYPTDCTYELMPSLKGFYENKKADGNIQNVVINGKFEEGMKRAGLGQFCRTDVDTIHFCTVESLSSMKIRIGTNDQDQKVFRGEYLPKGYSFIGYIAYKDSVDIDLIERIRECFSDGYALFGKMRSQGFGKCMISAGKAKDDVKPYAFNMMPENDIEGEVYMILLSDMVMRNGQDGEYCGADLDELAKDNMLGVYDLKISHCATSMVTVYGYNTKLGIKMPTVPMYERGSVFHLEFKGKLSKEKMLDLFDKGIGERKNEGFGRVLFLDKDYCKINKKVKFELVVIDEYDTALWLEDEDRKILKVIAKNYYKKQLENAKQQKIPNEVEKHPFLKTKAGTVLSILVNNRFQVDNIANTLELYFGHAVQKETKQNIHKERESSAPFSDYITKILTSQNYGTVVGFDNASIMGFPTSELISDEESKLLVVEYLIDLIKYAGKEI